MHRPPLPPASLPSAPVTASPSPGLPLIRRDRLSCPMWPMRSATSRSPASPIRPTANCSPARFPTSAVPPMSWSSPSTPSESAKLRPPVLRSSPLGRLLLRLRSPLSPMTTLRSSAGPHPRPTDRRSRVSKSLRSVTQHCVVRWSAPPRPPAPWSDWSTVRATHSWSPLPTPRALRLRVHPRPQSSPLAFPAQRCLLWLSHRVSNSTSPGRRPMATVLR
ncbi:unannotated protein [freshwater metagenome]|uniref:Unannotated protein n=1 Tax=freshwater metagenome TaxID=449393 RepID=A0A6J5YDB9_9ZZZZ